jgi:hypothetical protein
MNPRLLFKFKLLGARLALWKHRNRRDLKLRRRKVKQLEVQYLAACLGQEWDEPEVFNGDRIYADNRALWEGFRDQETIQSPATEPA